MIRDVHPGFGFFSIPDPDEKIKKHVILDLDTQHRIFFKCGPNPQTLQSVHTFKIREIFSRLFHCVAISSTTLLKILVILRIISKIPVPLSSIGCIADVFEHLEAAKAIDDD